MLHHDDKSGRDIGCMRDEATATSTRVCVCVWFFFFNDTATTEIYTLSLHYALPISYTISAVSPSTKCPSRSFNLKRARSNRVGFMSVASME